MLGDFFGVAEQIVGHRLVLFRGGAAQAGAGDRAHYDFFTFAAHQNFGGGADHKEVVEMVVKQIGRRIEGAQGAVEVQRVVRKRHGEPLAGHHLHAVALKNVVAHPAYMAFIAFFAGFVYRIMGFAAE